MATLDYIANVVEGLTRKHHTRDPYELCDALDIRIRYKYLGDKVKAFYSYNKRIRSIIINDSVSEIFGKVLVAHELGHDRLHQEIALLKGFKETGTFSMAIPTEYEANLFAAEILLDDETLLDMIFYGERTFFDIARELYVPYPLLEFKLRLLRNKGHVIDIPETATGDFLKGYIPGCFEDEW